MLHKEDHKIPYAVINRKYSRPKSYNIVDFYITYDKYTKDNKLMDIDYFTFRDILQDYFRHIRDKVIEEGKDFVLPGRCGVVSIRKFKAKPQRLQTDYKASKKLGKQILLLNEHTNGYRYKFHWNKLSLLVKNCTKYQITWMRDNKRRLAYILKNGLKDYIEL